jgi:hypothetical protein
MFFTIILLTFSFLDFIAFLFFGWNDPIVRYTGYTLFLLWGARLNALEEAIEILADVVSSSSSDD